MQGGTVTHRSQAAHVKATGQRMPASWAVAVTSMNENAVAECAWPRHWATA
jgi:hypothetical protein